MTSIFQFKQFDLDQTNCGMKISTDGIAFGSWVDASGADRILDVGVGSGLLSLMLAQRFPNAIIDAIEIEPTAAQRARENFENSPWSERLNLIEEDFKNFTATEKYDLVVSNPPYYSTRHSFSDNRRKLARSSASLSMENLLEGARNQLTKGELAVIIPSTQAEEFLNAFNHHGFHGLVEHTEIFPKLGGRANRSMIRVSVKEHDQLCEKTSLTVCDESNTYTNQFLEQTSAFYL